MLALQVAGLNLANVRFMLSCAKHGTRVTHYQSRQIDILSLVESTIETERNARCVKALLAYDRVTVSDD